MILLKGNNLSLGYDGKEVVNHISFEVNEGDYLCIVGENGAGKSTLMKTILGLIKPISGEIEFSNGLKRNEIGYLPQQTIVQKDFPASVKEIVLSGCGASSSFKMFYTKEDKRLAEENMVRMSIAKLKDASYRQLSGGQQQRVLLARALCASKRLLVLDEPVSGLDPKVTRELYELINRLNKDGVSVIMVSHDIDVALKYASHILHVGSNSFYGSKDEYLKSGFINHFKTTNESEVIY